MKFLNRYRSWVIFLGIVLVSANLRMPITSVGIVLSQIQATFHLTEVTASLIGVAPLVAFGLMSTFVPTINRQLGVKHTILYSLMVIFLGLFLRSFSDFLGFMVGTFLLAAGIQFPNVLMPSFIKENFPAQVGLVTGIYSASMNLTSSIFSQVTGPISLAIGWRKTLILPFIVLVAAVLVWSLQFFLKDWEDHDPSSDHVLDDPISNTNMWRSPLAWMITIFMALQSLQYYTAVNWFPVYFMDRGVTIENSSSLMALMQLTNIFASFAAPIIIARAKSSRPFVLAACLFALIVQCGLIFGPNQLLWFFAAMFGINAGCFFGLVTLWFTSRTKSAHDAAQLSGMCQGVGYLLSAVGPFLFGSLHGWTGHWMLSWTMMFINLFVLFVSGMGASQNKIIE